MALSYTTYQGRTQWFMQHWGVPAEVLKAAMEDAHTKLGVMIFPPRESSDGFPGRTHFTYATNGMSERRMPCQVSPHGRPEFRAELIAYTSSPSPWVAELLFELARYPFIHRSGCSLGDTFPVQAGTDGMWGGFLLTQPRLEPATFNPLAIDIGIAPDWVFHIQVLGLLASELDLAVELGGTVFAEQYLADSPSTTSFLDMPRSALVHVPRSRERRND